jgi:hypothetical protein
LLVQCGSKFCAPKQDGRGGAGVGTRHGRLPPATATSRPSRAPGTRREHIGDRARC